MRLAIGQIAVLQILKGNRTEKNDPRKILSIGLVASDFTDEFDEQSAVTVRRIRTCKGFVVSEHGKDNVRLNVLKVLIHGGEALTSWIIVGAVPGKGHIPKGNLLTF